MSSGSLPGKVYMAWLSQWIALPFVAVGTVLLLLFPGGRLPSRRWRAVAWVAVCGIAMYSFREASIPGHLYTHPSIKNPVGIGGEIGDVVALLSRIGIYLVLVSVLVAALSLINRLVRASGDERQQLKWFALAAGTMLGGFSAMQFNSWPLLGEIGWTLGVFGFMFFPVATGISILRYRLYDIDLLINRALVYGALTATLVAVYFGGIVLVQRLFLVLTGEKSTLAVVASTLLIVALFNPLRRRIQS
ncbi:MAG: histidine kinase N-terminal 7TM domain-containing protein, partial [Rubrobacter sp.]